MQFALCRLLGPAETGPTEPVVSARAAPTRVSVSLCVPRAGLCGSLSPTSGARRRMSCPQPPGRRRPPRTSRCSRPPPPPPVSSAAGILLTCTRGPLALRPHGPPVTHALQGLGRRHPPLPTRPAHAWRTGLVMSPRAARVPGVPGVPAAGSVACSSPRSWGLAEAPPCSKERVCPCSYCDPLRTDHYLWRLDL